MNGIGTGQATASASDVPGPGDSAGGEDFAAGLVQADDLPDGLVIAGQS